jgi:hypothetical protein
MPDRMNCDGVGAGREYDAPVTGAQPHSGGALEAFTSPLPAAANAFNLRSICVAESGRREFDLFHVFHRITR